MRLTLCVLFASALQAGVLFEPNSGQTDSQVQFLAQTSRGVVFLTGDALVFQTGTEHVTLRFLDASPGKAFGEDPAPGQTISYKIGRDPQRWIDDLPRFRRVRRPGLYPGVDLVLYAAADGELEYDLVAAPGADLSRIRLRASQAVASSIDGSLRIGKHIHQRKPVAFQAGRRLAFEAAAVDNHTIEFRPGRDYDPAQALVIDPVLEALEYFGGGGEDSITAIGANNEIAGTTTSIDFPDGALARRHGTDVFLRDRFRTQVIGGSGDDVLTSHTPRAPGTPSAGLVIGGYTNSRDLPTSRGIANNLAPNDLQLEYAGGEHDGFLLYAGQLNGSAYFTYVGTSGDDRITCTTWESTNGYAAVGYTDSGSGFPVGDSSGQYAGGAHDGFLVQFALQPIGYTVRYFGGTGDDKPSSLTYDAVSSKYYVTGELDGHLFVTRLDAKGIAERTALLAGSGTETGNAVGLLRGGRVAVAGTTSSADLPFLKGAYAGGGSDSLVAIFDKDLNLAGGSYLGGTGADEALALSSDLAYGNLFAGGRTSSTDLPRNGESPYHGGESDGFVARLDPATGELLETTYIGGSRRDEILALGVRAGPSINFGGATASPDLEANSTKLNGASDALLGELSYPEIQIAPRLVVGKDGWPSFPFVRGPRLVEVTAESSNPAQVAVIAIDQQAATVTLECQSATGEAEITLSAEGFGSAKARAVCVAMEVAVANTLYQPEASISSPGYAFNRYLIAVARDPETGVLSPQRLRPGFFPGVRAEVEKSAIATTGPVTPLATPLNGVPWVIALVSITPHLSGRTAIAFSAPEWASSRVPLNISPAFGLLPVDPATGDYMLTVGKGFNRSFGFVAGITATNNGPANVYSFSVAGTELRLRGEGEAGSEGSIRVQVSGFSGPVDLKVRVVPVEFTLTLPNRLDLAPNQTVLGGLTFWPIGEDAYSMTPSQPQADLLRVQSTNATIATGSVVETGVEVRSAGVAGTATVVVSSPRQDIRPRGAAAQSMQVTVGKARVALPPLMDLARGIRALLTISTSAASSLYTVSDAPRRARVRSLDPTLVRVGVDPGAVFTGEVTFPMPGPLSNVILEPLAVRGETTLEVDVDGFPTARMTMRLHPPGLVFATESLLLQQGTLMTSPRVEAVALDEQTLEPLAQYPLGFPASVPFVVESANSNIVAVVSGGLVPGQAGTTTVRVVQPGGFRTPVLRQVMRVTVRLQQLSLVGPSLLSTGLQAQVLLGGSVPPGTSIKITSSDPTRILFTNNFSQRGTPELNFRSVEGVWAQGLASEGFVTIRISASGFTDATLRCDFAPLRAQLSGSTVGYLGTNVPLKIQLVPLPTGLGSNQRLNYSLMPGASMTNVYEIRNLNPEVGRVAASPVTLTGLESNVAFEPLTTGVAQLELVAANERTAPVYQGISRLEVRVNKPRLLVGPISTTVTVAPDTIAEATVRLAQTNVNDAVVTVTSPDPGRVLLSLKDDAASPRVPSIQIPLSGAVQTTFYVHGVANSGDVNLRFSAPNFEDATLPVRLTKIEARVNFNASAFVSTAPAGNMVLSIDSPFGLRLRKGAQIKARLWSSNPGLLGVVESELVFQPLEFRKDFYVKALGEGAADLLWELLPPHAASGSVRVDVRRGVTTWVGRSFATVAKNMTAQLLIQHVGLNFGEKVRYTSSDPSKFLLAAGGLPPFTASIEKVFDGNSAIPIWQNLMILGLADSGEAELIVESPSLQTTRLPVKLIASVPVFANPPAQPVSVPVDPVRLNRFRVTLEGIGESLGCCIAPGYEPQVQVTSSDPTVVKVERPVVTLTSASETYVEFTALSPGTAQIGLSIVGASTVILPGPASPRSVLSVMVVK